MKIELKIVDFLARNSDREVTINEIAKGIDEYYSFVYRTVNNLMNSNVIKKIKAGQAYLCSLNFENEKTLILLQELEYEKGIEFFEKNKELKVIISDFIPSVMPNIITAVLFGSYAKGKATKESDIDILILAKKKIDVGKLIKEMYAKYGKQINPIIMTIDEFKKQNDKTLIKEILNSHLVLYSIIDFVRIFLKNES